MGFKKGDTIIAKQGRIVREVNRVLNITCASEHMYLVKNKFGQESTLTQIEAARYEKFYDSSSVISVLNDIFGINSNE